MLAKKVFITSYNGNIEIRCENKYIHGGQRMKYEIVSPSYMGNKVYCIQTKTNIETKKEQTTCGECDNTVMKEIK